MWHWWNDERLAWLLWPGLAGLALAVTAWLADRRRQRRSNPDAVGLMPWTGLFFFGLFAAVVLLGLAARVWLSA